MIAAFAAAVLLLSFAPDALARLARPRRRDGPAGLLNGVGVPQGRMVLVVCLARPGAGRKGVGR